MCKGEWYIWSPYDSGGIVKMVFYFIVNHMKAQGLYKWLNVLQALIHKLRLYNCVLNTEIWARVCERERERLIVYTVYMIAWMIAWISRCS